jgi:PLP dependent protein
VNAPSSVLIERLGELRSRIDAAARRSGRPNARVTLIGAVKGVHPERIREAVSAGLADLGENRVQEAESAKAALGDLPASGGAVRWHMIGHLQRNKAAKAIALFDRVHSVDSIELAETLSRLAEARGVRIPTLVQINVSGEASKHGSPPDEAAGLLERAAALPGLAIDGLMAIGRATDRPDEARRELVFARELRDRLERETGLALPELSMGMSGDFEAAVEEGSTMVRIGTALFGART